MTVRPLKPAMLVKVSDRSYYEAIAQIIPDPASDKAER